MTIAQPTADDLLDLALKRRSETVRFDLLDSSNAVQGTLSISREQVGTVANDVTRPIHRTLGPLHISPGDLSGVDTFSDRVRPVWVLDPNDSAYQFNLGVFLFADASRQRRTYGTHLVGRLVDQRLILNQPLLETVNYAIGKNIGVALTEQFAAAGIVAASVDATTAALTAPNTWIAGRDTRLKVMEDLSEIAGYLPPYFDGDGTGISRAAPNLVTAPADFTYGAGTRMIDESVVESDDLLDAPNVYTVIDAAPGGILVGRYEVPASAPHSYANRGFWRPAKQVEVQGLASQAAADAAAQAASVNDKSAYRWLAFDSTPDPRHDTHNILAYDDGLTYLERSWSLPLKHGAEMGHTASAVYAT